MKVIKVKDKRTGEIKEAVYSNTPKYKLRYHIDSRPVSDKFFNKNFEIIREQSTDDSLTWKVNTPGLLRELIENGAPDQMGILKIPINIFQSLLCAVADRAIELNDKELNKLMIRLGLYEGSHTPEVLEYLKK